MNKNTLLKIGAGALVGAAIGFGIDMVVKKHKQKEVNEVEPKEIRKVVKEEVRKVVKEKEPNELDYAVRMVKIIFGSMIIMSLISTVSSHFSPKLVESDDIWDAIAENRKFNEINFVMMVCHVCDTDTTMSAADKIVELTKLVESNKLGDAAVGLLKEQINALMEVK